MSVICSVHPDLALMTPRCANVPRCGCCGQSHPGGTPAARRARSASPAAKRARRGSRAPGRARAPSRSAASADLTPGYYPAVGWPPGTVVAVLVSHLR